jgi:hypothetical protein
LRIELELEDITASDVERQIDASWLDTGGGFDRMKR